MSKRIKSKIICLVGSGHCGKYFTEGYKIWQKRRNQRRFIMEGKFIPLRIYFVFNLFVGWLNRIYGYQSF